MVEQFAQKLLGSEAIPMLMSDLRTNQVGPQHSFERPVREREDDAHRVWAWFRLSAGSPPAVQRHSPALGLG